MKTIAVYLAMAASVGFACVWLGHHREAPIVRASGTVHMQIVEGKPACWCE